MGTDFKIGDLVRVKPDGRTRVMGIHEVVEVVPSGMPGERLYRLRSARAATERTVSERQISRA